MDSDFPDWADLWAPADADAREFEEARSVIRSRELEDLREMGVDVDDPDALARARADHYIMAQLRGRQLRELLQVRRREGHRFDPRGFADDLREARARQLEAAHAGAVQ